MKHARDDYNRIQDPANKIPEDEPVFLLRGQDILAPGIVLKWAEWAERQGGVTPEMIKAARDHAAAMREWQKKQNVKIPDL